MLRILEDYAKVNPMHAEVLMTRVHMQEKKRAIIENRSDYMTLIDVVNSILSDVELQLEHQGKYQINYIIFFNFIIP